MQKQYGIARHVLSDIFLLQDKFSKARPHLRELQVHNCIVWLDLWRDEKGPKAVLLKGVLGIYDTRN